MRSPLWIPLLGSMFLLFASTVWLTGCGDFADDDNEIIVYTSVDDPYARAVQQAFHEYGEQQVKAGAWEEPIRVHMQTDPEDQKTVALANRLIAERDNPRADVWFPSEPTQTVRLKEEGVLAPYVSAERTEARGEQFHGDEEGTYNTFAVRLRVLVRRTDGPAWPEEVPFDLRHLPEALEVLREQGVVAEDAPVFRMADPQFGTTNTHAAAMVQAWGEEATREWHEALQRLGTYQGGGNMNVVRDVAAGRAPWGITDTDDVFARQAQGDEIEMFVPEDTLAFPCTVALVDGARNEEAAKRFIDWLLSPAGEETMAATAARFYPTRSDVTPPEGFPDVDTERLMNVDWSTIRPELDTAVKLIREIFHGD